ncbi:hypothetical protein [Candidatus Palauibacter sp.]|uniref:hypothetical protein n=1 Tax=Candidatus Palauibacter sp. TaxID=3101350 RepID=UPI003B5C8D56
MRRSNHAAPEHVERQHSFQPNVDISNIVSRCNLVDTRVDEAKILDQSVSFLGNNDFQDQINFIASVGGYEGGGDRDPIDFSWLEFRVDDVCLEAVALVDESGGHGDWLWRVSTTDSRVVAEERESRRRG